MIRISLLTLVVIFLSGYAYKDWFKSACGLVLLMAVIQHPDMPKSIGGIPGFNLWNVLMANVLIAWVLQKRKEALDWDMPRIISALLIIYGLIVVIGFIRFGIDQSGLTLLRFHSPIREDTNTLGWFNEYVANAIKFVIPGLLIYHGCRTYERFRLAMFVCLGVYVLLALQVIKTVKLGSLGISGEALQRQASKLIASNVGYNRVTMSMMLSGAFWAVFALREVVTRTQFFFAVIPVCCVIFLGMALTGGRTGYLTWASVGLIFCCLKGSWRSYLLLAPLAIPIAFWVAPSAVERLAQGVFEIEGAEDTAQNSYINRNQGDVNALTSGRVLAWQYVFREIRERPLVGYGRNGMENGAGVTMRMLDDFGNQGDDVFGHPHNLYLEWLLDNGLIGTLPVLLLFFIFMKYSFSLFLDRRNPVFALAGGVSAALGLGLLIAGVSSSTLYPREGAVCMWLAFGLMLRVHRERAKLLTDNPNRDLSVLREELWTIASTNHAPGFKRPTRGLILANRANAVSAMQRKA